MNVSCGLPNVVEFVGTSTSYTGLGFRSHPGYQLFILRKTGIYMAGAVYVVVPTYWTTTQFYMAGAVYVVVPTYWTTHNFIIQITTIKVL
jgi:hypothetical protein